MQPPHDIIINEMRDKNPQVLREKLEKKFKKPLDNPKLT